MLYVDSIYPGELEIESCTSVSYMDISVNIDSGAILTVWLYKQDDFNFAIANFLYTCNNFPASPACGVTVYISVYSIW
jgi:hypothetical protein